MSFFAVRRSAVLLLLAAASCKKTDTKYPFAALTSFQLTDNTGAALTASIDSNTIIVYWPPMQDIPDSIAPVISVSPRATVQPSSGTRIPFNAGFTYTVTAQNGITQTYVLKPVINQAPVQITDVYPNNGAIGTPLSIRLEGQYFIADTNQTSVVLVSPKGQKIRTAIEASITSSQLYFDVTLADTGTYTIQLTSGQWTANGGTLTLTLPPPQVTFPVGVVVARGGTLTINGSFLSGVSSVVTYDVGWSGPYGLTIVSKTDKAMVVQVPSDLAPGEYIDLSVTASGSSYDFYVDPGQGFMVN